MGPLDRRTLFKALGIGAGCVAFSEMDRAEAAWAKQAMSQLSLGAAGRIPRLARGAPL